MSNNPYADFSPAHARPVSGAPSRPGALTAVAVIALVLGILGFFSSCLAVVMLPMQTQFQAALGGIAPGPSASPIERQQYEMQVALAAMNQEYIVPQMVIAAAHIILAACMIIGATLVLRGRERGRAFLIYTVLIVIVFELLRTAFAVFLQLQMLPVYDEFVNRMAREATASSADQTILWITRMMKGVMLAVVVFAVAWPLAKIIIYGLSARYLSGDVAREYFARASAKSNPPTA
jgi:hypothetical protein